MRNDSLSMTSGVRNPRSSELFGQLPQLHLVQWPDWDREPVAFRVEADVSRLHHLVGDACALPISQQSYAGVVPRRDHEPSIAHRLNAVEPAVPDREPAPFPRVRHGVELTLERVEGRDN